MKPLIFNTFIDNIFYVLKTIYNSHNYADDNTLLNTYHSIADLKYNLETSATVAIHRLDVNRMKSNQAKFQATVLNNHPDASDISLCVNEYSIETLCAMTGRFTRLWTKFFGSCYRCM